MTPSLDLDFAIWMAGMHVFKMLYLKNYTGNPQYFACVILLNEEFIPLNLKKLRIHRQIQ